MFQIFNLFPKFITQLQIVYQKDFCVQDNIGFINTTFKVPQLKLVFGEYKKIEVELENNFDQEINNIYIFSSNPLNSGFVAKKFQDLKPKQKREEYFYIRATMAKPKDFISFLVCYQTENFIRSFVISLTLEIQNSFKIKGQFEKLDYQTYLMVANIYSKQNNFGADTFDIDKLYILSNSLLIKQYPIECLNIPNEFLEQQNMVYFIMQSKNGVNGFYNRQQNSSLFLNQTEDSMKYFINDKRPQSDEANFLEQSSEEQKSEKNIENDNWEMLRTEKQVFLEEQNSFKPNRTSEDKIKDTINFNNLKGFLEIENKVIKKEYQSNFLVPFYCRELVEFELLWRYKDKEDDQYVKGLHTILNVPINYQNYRSKKKNYQMKHINFRVSLSTNQNEIYVDFQNQKKVEIPINFEVECLNDTKTNSFLISSNKNEPLDLFYQWIGNKYVELGQMKANDIIRFQKKVCVFKPGIYNIGKFFIKDKSAQKNKGSIKIVNKNEEFIIFIIDN